MRRNVIRTVALMNSSYFARDTLLDEMTKLRGTLCGLAEEIASSFDIQLDYSDDSIRHVEFILSKVHDEFVTTRDEEGIFGIALEFGAYLASVIERHHGPVKWSRDHPEIGKESFPLKWNGTTLFPVGWCLKRIVDGSGDDIVFKWRALVLSREGGAAAK
jgi:hypothetical protein